jgi:hypothetical protein
MVKSQFTSNFVGFLTLFCVVVLILSATTIIAHSTTSDEYGSSFTSNTAHYSNKIPRPLLTSDIRINFDPESTLSPQSFQSIHELSSNEISTLSTSQPTSSDDLNLNHLVIQSALSFQSQNLALLVSKMMEIMLIISIHNR